MSDRTIEYDLKFLLAVLNWAARSRDEEGRLLLESNPLRGLKTPKQKNPARVLLTDAEYEALLNVSLQMDWRFRVALVIVHETGHRIGAIRQLRWSDINMERRTIRWRAEHEKTGHEHRTPVTAEALDAQNPMSPPGLEPGAYCLGGSRSIHLSYGDVSTGEDRCGAPPGQVAVGPRGFARVTNDPRRPIFRPVSPNVPRRKRFP